MPGPAVAEMTGIGGAAAGAGGTGATTTGPAANVGSIASSLPHRRASASTSAPAASASTSTPRGAFIVLEGVDRCGKTTQCARLVERLRASGVKAEMWRFPDRTTEIGTMINAYLGRSRELDDAAVHLLFSANRWEKRAALLQALSRGTTLVCDRYAFSGVAFTAAKGKEGMGFDWCRAPDEGLPAPDAVLYLDLDPAEAEKRGGFGEERYENAEMLQSVRDVFNEIAAFVDGRCTRWLRIDASGTVDEVGERVGEAARAAVEAAASGEAPLRSLWDGSGGAVGWPLVVESPSPAAAAAAASAADEKKE